MTDGFQIKLNIQTAIKRATTGLDKLFQKSYSGFTTSSKNKKKHKINLTNASNGIYHLNKQDLEISDNITEYLFLGIDPGRKRPISVCCIDGGELPKQWNSTQRKYVVNSSMDISIK